MKINHQHQLIQPILIVVSVVLLAACSGKEEEQSAINSHISRSQAYESQGQYRAAIIEARNVIKKDRENIIGYERLAELYQALGNHKGVISLLEQTPAPLTNQGQLTLAKAYIGLGKFTSTLTIKDRYQNNGGNRDALEFKLIEAKILIGKKQKEEAISLLEDIARNFPDDQQAENLLATLYVNNKQYEQAKTLLQALLRSAPQDANAHYLSAYIAYLQNDLPQAEKGFTYSLLEQPETDVMLPLRAATLKQLSKVLTEQGRSAEALVYSKLLADTNPEATEAQSQFTKALSYLKEGKLDKAEAILQALNQDYPENDVSALYLGLINYQKGDYYYAEELLSKHIDTETASPKLVEATVAAKLRLQKANEALSILKEALKTYPDNEQLNAIYGLTALQSEQAQEQEKGVITLEKLIAANPDNLTLKLALARYYLQNDREALAIAQLEQLIKEKPDHINVTALYASAHLQQGNIDKAQKAALDLLKNHGETPTTFNLAAHIAVKAQNVEAAQAYFQKAANLDNQNLIAYQGLANLAFSQKDLEAARGYFEQSITIDPTRPASYKGLISSYEVEEKRTKAINSMQRYVKQYRKETATPAAVLAEFHLRQGNVDKAVHLLSEDNIQGDDSNYKKRILSSVYFARFQSFANTEKWSEARVAIMRALDYSPNHERLTYELINLEIVSGNLVQASELINLAQQQHPQTTMPILAQAKLLTHSGKTEEAKQLLITHWQQQKRPEIAAVLVEYAEPQSKEYQKWLKSWVELQPNNPIPLSMLAVHAQSSNQSSDAKHYYQQILNVQPNNLLALNNLAWLYHEDGKEEALILAAKAYQLAPENASVIDTYGWIETQLGDRQKGLALLEKALALEPNSPDIKNHIEQAKVSLKTSAK